MREQRLLVISLFFLAGCMPDHTGNYDPPKPAHVKAFDRIKNPDIVLLVTGGTNAMMEVCNCAGPMPGGLARRSGLAISYRAAFPHTFLLDSGDVFTITPTDVQNDYVLRGYRQIGYDAVVLGDQEWEAGPDALAKLLAGGGDYLATTVAVKDESSSLPLQQVIKRDWGDVKLAVVSAVLEKSLLFFPPEQRAKLQFDDIEKLAARVDELKKEGYLVVAVAHGSEEDVRQLAGKCRADLIVEGHTSKTSPKLLHAGPNDTPVVKAGGPDWVSAAAIKLLPGGGIDVEYRAELVDERWPLDARLLQTYQAYAHVAMQHYLDAKRTSGLDYVPSADCSLCHTKQYESWLKTRHASAYATLQKVERTGDPNCLICHTTGAGTEKGFYTIEKTPQMANVNCQDCHRFNIAEHIKIGYEFPKFTEDICTTCHTPVTDPSFSYRQKVGKVRCPHE